MITRGGRHGKGRDGTREDGTGKDRTGRGRDGTRMGQKFMGHGGEGRNMGEGVLWFSRVVVYTRLVYTRYIIRWERTGRDGKDGRPDVGGGVASSSLSLIWLCTLGPDT